MNDKM